MPALAAVLGEGQAKLGFVGLVFDTLQKVGLEYGTTESPDRIAPVGETRYAGFPQKVFQFVARAVAFDHHPAGADEVLCLFFRNVDDGGQRILTTVVADQLGGRSRTAHQQLIGQNHQKGSTFQHR